MYHMFRYIISLNAHTVVSLVEIQHNAENTHLCIKP